MCSLEQTYPVIHSSLLPRINVRGNVLKLVENLENIQSETSINIYNALMLGNIMENIFKNDDRENVSFSYDLAKTNMRSIDDFCDNFTLNDLFIKMQIRTFVNEEMAMEIAQYIQIFLPQRSYEKVPIHVISKNAKGKTVSKALEVKLYYAYEADAVMWLIKTFFNRIDLININHRILDDCSTVLDIVKDYEGLNKEVIQNKFFGSDFKNNADNHILFQSILMSEYFPTNLDLFQYSHSVDFDVNDDDLLELEVYECCGIYKMYIEKCLESYIL